MGFLGEKHGSHHKGTECQRGISPPFPACWRGVEVRAGVAGTIWNWAGAVVAAWALGRAPTHEVAPDIISSSPGLETCHPCCSLEGQGDRSKARLLLPLLTLGEGRRLSWVSSRAGTQQCPCPAHLEHRQGGAPCHKSCLVNAQKGSFASQQKEMKKQEIRD